MQAGRGRLAEGVHCTPYEILQAIYDVKWNLTMLEIMRLGEFDGPEVQDAVRQLVNEGFIQETQGLLEKGWRGYRITRRGRMLATAYATGIVQAMRLHAAASGTDRIPEFRRQNQGMFAHDRPDEPMHNRLGGLGPGAADI